MLNGGHEREKDKKEDKKEEKKNSNIFKRLSLKGMGLKSSDSLTQSFSALHLDELPTTEKTQEDSPPSNTKKSPKEVEYSNRRRSLPPNAYLNHTLTSPSTPSADKAKIITLTEAIEADNVDTFILLLQQGATLTQRDLKENTEKRLTFLKIAQTELTKLIGFSALQGMQQVCDNISATFNHELTRKSSPQPTKNVRLDNRNPDSREKVKELTRLILELCQSAVNSSEDQKTVSEIVVGILAEYHALNDNLPNTIVEILSSYYPEFSISQRKTLLFILKEIILWDQFYHCYRQENFHQTILRLFGLSNEEDLIIFKNSILKLIELEKQLYSPLLQALAYIQDLLIQFGVFQGDKIFSKLLYHVLHASRHPESRLKELADILAHDLILLTTDFFQRVDASEFLEQRWKNEKNKETLSPTILYQIEFFNKVSAFFVEQILNCTTDTQAQHVMSLCIYTIDKLLSSTKPGSSLIERSVMVNICKCLYA